MSATPKVLLRTSTANKQNLLALRQEPSLSGKLPSIFSQQTISVETPKRVKELVPSPRGRAIDVFPSESPRKRIIFTHVHKNSSLGFGIVSDSTTGVTPLEPFSKALKNRMDRKSQPGLLRVSPRDALLYKTDGIDFLNCKLNKITRDDSCHSLEVPRSDFDNFCRDSPAAPVRLTRPLKPKGAHHRRKSCACTWCGGVSKLEKAIQNHPDIPSSICQRHCGNGDDSETNRTTTSINSRESSWKGRSNAPSRISPKKSIFGSVGRASLVLDGMRPSFRSMRRTSTLLTSVRKEFSSFKPQQELTKQKTPSKIELLVKTAAREDSNSQSSNCSITLEIPPIISPLQNTDRVGPSQLRSKTLANLKTSISSKKLPKFDNVLHEDGRYLQNGYAGPLRTNRPQEFDISSELLNTLEEECESPLKLKNPKGNSKKKGQKNLACTTQRIKDIYTSISSPKIEKASQRLQPISIVIPSKKKITSPTSLGLDTSKGLSSPRPKELYKKKDLQIKTEKSTAPGSLELKPIPSLKIETSSPSFLNSARALKTPYLSPRLRTLVSSNAKASGAHKRGITMC